jgi:hypothetical protein
LWHEAAVRECPLLFSNRPSRVKHFQATHHFSVDVAHGLARGAHAAAANVKRFKGIDAATMLVGADLRNRHILSPPPQHLHHVQTDAPVTLRPLILFLAQRVSQI